MLLVRNFQNRTVMELRFLPTSITPGTNNLPDGLHHMQNNNCEPSPRTDQHNRRNQTNRHAHAQPQPFNGTLMNGLPPIQNMGSTTEIGIPQVTDLNNRIPSLRRTPRRTVPNGLPVPQSPRFMRSGGISNDILNHNRSPISSRVAAATMSSKRHRLGGHNNENISCGSLNSIEV